MSVAGKRSRCRDRRPVPLGCGMIVKADKSFGTCTLPQWSFAAIKKVATACLPWPALHQLKQRYYHSSKMLPVLYSGGQHSPGGPSAERLSQEWTTEGHLTR